MATSYNYPSQQITEISKEVNPVLTDFFERFHDFYEFPIENLSLIVIEILNEMGSLSPADMKVEYERERGNRKAKRLSWMKRLADNSKKFPPSSQSSYFHAEVEHILLDAAYGASKYGTSRTNEIVDKILSTVSSWKLNGDFLIKCPLFPNVGRVNIFDTFKSDLKFDLYRIIQKNYGGNLKAWGMSTPYDFVKNNIYSAQRGNVETEEVNSRVVGKMYSSEQYDVQLVLDEEIAEHMVEVKLPIVDEQDREIVSFLLNNMVIDLNSSSGYHGKHQRTTLGEIASYVYHTSKPSATQRDIIQKRLYHLMVPVEVNNKQTNVMQKWVLLQNVKIAEVGERGTKEVIYTLGDVLYDSAIQNRLVSVPSSKYHELGDSYARSLYYILQMERIALSGRNESLEKTYSITFFIQSMLLRYKSVSRNKKLILEALEEIREKSGILQDFSIKGASFVIKYYALTNDEKKDYIGLNTTFQLGNDGYSKIDLIEKNEN